jgi:hypothetical protein
MNPAMNGCASTDRLCGNLRAAFAEFGQPKGRLVPTRAPGVADVMGGICEEIRLSRPDGHAGLSVKAYLGETEDANVRVRLHQELGRRRREDFSPPRFRLRLGRS